MRGVIDTNSSIFSKGDPVDIIDLNGSEGLHKIIKVLPAGVEVRPAYTHEKAWAFISSLCRRGYYKLLDLIWKIL